MPSFELFNKLCSPELPFASDEDLTDKATAAQRRQFVDACFYFVGIALGDPDDSQLDEFDGAVSVNAAMDCALCVLYEYAKRGTGSEVSGG